MSGKKLYIIGVGPGDESYITPAARAQAAECDLLLGSQRLTRLFDRPSRELDLKGDPPAAVRFILENRAHLKIGVLVSGDPGLYSFLGVISNYLRQEEFEVVPGISSVQLAFARLKEGWEDAFILSLHGRDADGLAGAVRQHPTVAILTDGRWTSREIARNLLEHGIEDRELIICENLSYPEERIIASDIRGALAAADSQGLSVVIIRKGRGCQESSTE